MKMKRFIVFLFCICMALCIVACGEKKDDPFGNDASDFPFGNDKDGGLRYYYKTGDKYLQVKNDGKFENIYVAGVNIGSGIANYFPGELGITKEQYLRWFEEISSMNANCIRVYTMMMPCFYDALLEYNKSASSEQRLYLFQGLWYNEDILFSTYNAWAVYDLAVKESKELVDVLHGKANIAETTGRAYGKYSSDISPYVIGWMLGIDCECELIEATDASVHGEKIYNGKYVCTKEKANGYEVFMASLADSLIAYEIEKYNMTRPLSFNNWPVTDILEHPNAPHEEEDGMGITMEHLRATEEYPAGLFANYNIYPYYPEYIYADTKYAEYRNDEGEPDTYKAYLEELISHYSMPLIVAEYGVPVSRGKAHENNVMGISQGDITEKEQSRILTLLSQDIFEAGCAGGMVFGWQDEWSKKTWNTKAYSNPDQSAYWHDVQTSDQFFGLLAIESSESGKRIIDGNKNDWVKSDWTNKKKLLTQNGLTLEISNDSTYLYILAEGENIRNRHYIAFDITPLSGTVNGMFDGTKLADGTDFVLMLDGEDNSRLLVQAYYDRYAYEYYELDPTVSAIGMRNPESSIFNPIKMLITKKCTFPETGKKVDYSGYETGKLLYGNGDLNSPDGNSLADFCFGEDFVEIRIAYSLLNFRNPSKKEVEDDFWERGFRNDFHVSEIGISVAGEDTSRVPYIWENWNNAEYSERLRKAYYVLKDKFKIYRESISK
ncbi:MAG: family 2 glycosyl transferase [Lachnospiraceae bacterium]|nr:family 2 glycosyl transferase [Lachnospiraceae bacterium]